MPEAERQAARQRGYAPDVRWHVRKSGERFWLDGAAWPLRDASAYETGFLKVGRDATQARQAELLMQQAVERQAFLTREVGHRIKNNLAIVTSLLTLQARNAGSEETRTALSDARGRIEAIAQVHDQLWRQEQSETINLDAYLRDLCARVQRTMPQHRLTYSGDGETPVPVPIDDAVTVSLIVNELITNAAKYAYPEQEGGPIAVGLSSHTGQSLRIEVADTGVGIPREIAAGEIKAGSLGMRMLRNLSRQLDAELAIDTGSGGTRVVVTIPSATKASENAPE
jgi:two-component sensor histidine kinase